MTEQPDENTEDVKYSQDKRKRLSDDLYQSIHEGWGGEGVKTKQDDLDRKFQTHRGTNLDYDMLCEPIGSENEEKEGDNLSGHLLTNLQNFATNI